MASVESVTVLAAGVTGFAGLRVVVDEVRFRAGLNALVFVKVESPGALGAGAVLSAVLAVVHAGFASSLL